MDNNQKKILQIVTNLRLSNGVTSVVMNHYKKLISSGYQVDFCAMLDRPSPYISEIKNYGGNYYLMPQKNGEPDIKSAGTYITSLIRKNAYNIVHVHPEGKFACTVLFSAKNCKVKNRVFHAHNPKYSDGIYSWLRNEFFTTICVNLSNQYVACSEKAGKSVFGNRKFSIVKNTIDTKKISFSTKGRQLVRNQIGAESDEFVLGTVCRQTLQKNPFFIVETYNEIHKMYSKSKFIWVGTGEMEEEVKGMVHKLGLENSVFFLGSREDMNNVYSAMDCFVLPSLYEGLGIVFVEAQSTGVMTIASDVVPEDTKITDLIEYISLNISAKEWAEHILNRYKQYGRLSEEQRMGYCSKVREAGYDREFNNDLCEFYKNLEN